LDEPGNEAGDSGDPVVLTRDLRRESFLREEVDGGLGGRTFGVDMFANSAFKWRRRRRSFAVILHKIRQSTRPPAVSQHALVADISP
jgi:hypothetical protein